jgi:hypothetical protein
VIGWYSVAETVRLLFFSDGLLRRRYAARIVGVSRFAHTFASWLVVGGIDLPTVPALLGHNEIAMTLLCMQLTTGFWGTVASISL